jgi:hypothetical protein
MAAGQEGFPYERRKTAIVFYRKGECTLQPISPLLQPSAAVNKIGRLVAVSPVRIADEAELG